MGGMFGGQPRRAVAGNGGGVPHLQASDARAARAHAWAPPAAPGKGATGGRGDPPHGMIIADPARERESGRP
jgi:hypothetical protein